MMENDEKCKESWVSCYHELPSTMEECFLKWGIGGGVAPMPCKSAQKFECSWVPSMDQMHEDLLQNSCIGI